jgi:UDP-N-acetylglucosamine 2-epimerase (non-hydrolysing)
MIRATLADVELATDRDLLPVPPGSSLSHTLGHLRAQMGAQIAADRPDLVIVQGDTSTAYAGALAARATPASPSPMSKRDCAPPTRCARFRRSRSVAASPPSLAGISRRRRARVSICWTRVSRPIASMWSATPSSTNCAAPSPPRAPTATDWRARGAQLLVLTLHRRETYGQALVAVCVTMLELLERHEDLVLVCPVHPNPAVGLRVRRLLGAHPRCLLVAPMGYRDFVQLLGDARLVVTDSGGIQEEAPYLGVPVLVAREATERPEALRAGAVELVGHDHDRLIHAALRLLTAPRPTPVAFDANAPFGDGDSAPRILDLLMTSHHAESR